MTNELVKLNNSSLTMTSREIAELTGKRHCDVLRDIDVLVESLHADLRLGFKSNSYKDSTGKNNRQYEMDRDSTYCLMAGYDANARMRIIKRWQELELAQQQAQQNLSENYSVADLRALSAAALVASESALATAKANRILADTALALANQYERNSQTETPVSPTEPQPKSQQALLPPREAAFIQAWWSCLGTQTVTASDLYRAIATQQCQELNETSGALMGDISQWTAKKLSHALKRWSQLVLDNFTVINLGKTSRGILWRLERKN